jgi:hypothetical protein
VQVPFDGLDVVFTIAPRAVEVVIHLLRRWSLSGRHPKPRGIASGHDFRLDDHPPRLLP